MGMEGGKQALGEAEGSNFYTTTDYGASWSLTALNVPSGGAAPSTEATILSKDGITLVKPPRPLPTFPSFLNYCTPTNCV